MSEQAVLQVLADFEPLSFGEGQNETRGVTLREVESLCDRGYVERTDMLDGESSYSLKPSGRRRLTMLKGGA